MKKIVTLIMLLYMVCTGAWAQTHETPAWDNHDNLKISPALNNRQFTGNVTFYSIKNKKVNGYLSSTAKSNSSLTVNGTNSVNDNAKWAIIGNTTNGFQFINKSTLEAIGMTPFNITDQENQTSETASFLTTDYTDPKTYFAITEHRWYGTTGNENMFVITDQSTKYYYWNNLNTLGYWYSGENYEYGFYGWKKATTNKGDDGASWKLTEVETVDYTPHFPSAGTYHVTLTGKTTDRKNYLHSNVDNLLNGNLYTWLAESASTNYNYIWKIVVDANKNATIVNAQGTPLILKKESDKTTAVLRSNVTFEAHSGSYYIKIANNSELKNSTHNCLNISDNNYANGDVRAVTSWSTTDGPNASDNHWDINEITGNDFYDVVIVDGIAATGANYSSATYVTYDGQKVFNGGFFAVATGTVVSDSELSVNNLPANKQAVVSISDHTINITFEDAPSGPDWSVYENTLNTLKLYTVGDGLGEYSCTLGERNITSGTLDIYKNNYQTHFQSQSESYYDEDLSQMESLIAGMRLNMPETGKFYRLKSVAGNHYLSNNCPNNGSGAITMNGDKKTSIFFLDENYGLLAYADGMYVRNPWRTGVKGETVPGHSNEPYDAAWSFTEGQIGKYAIIYPGDYLLDGSGDNAGYAVNNDVNKKADNTQWIIEKVVALPVTIGSTGFATFYTPVAVVVSPLITPYVCHLEGENLSVYTCKQTTNIGGREYVVIPAETAVMLKGSTADMSISENDEAEAYSNNSFFGDVATKPFATDYTYYSLQKDSQNVSQVGFFIKSSGNFKGFQAFLKTDIMNPVQRFNVSFDDNALVTDITNVLGTENVTIPAYDLSGRKVNANGHRGLYIMNGKRIIR